MKSIHKELANTPKESIIDGLKAANPTMNDEEAEQFYIDLKEALKYQSSPQEIRARGVVDKLGSENSRNSHELDYSFEPESLKRYKKYFLSIPLFMPIFAGKKEEK